MSEHEMPLAGRVLGETCRELAVVKAAMDSRDCTYREGGDTRHCRHDRKCLRCERDALAAHVRRAWEAGFQLCRSYGDNHHHFDGEQKEAQWLKYCHSAALAAQEADRG